jgi:hypothetical protein
MKLRVAILVSVVVAFVGCSDDSNDSAVSTESSPSVTSEAVGQVPDPEQLAAMLVSEADLDDDWAVNPWGLPPTDSGSIGFGESKFAALVCDDAPEEFRAAVEALNWQAIVHLDKETDGASVEELLWADEPDAAASLYSVLEEGLDACMGKPGRGIGTTEPLTVPEVGDERTGVVIRIGEPGNERSTTYWVLLRDGSVLMSAQIAGQVTPEQAEQIITTMTDKIE